MNDPDDKWPMTVAYDGICRIDYPGGTWKNIPEVKGLVTIEYQPMDQTILMFIRDEKEEPVLVVKFFYARFVWFIKNQFESMMDNQVKVARFIAETLPQIEAIMEANK